MKVTRIVSLLVDPRYASIAVLFAMPARAQEYHYEGDGGFNHSLSLPSGQYYLYVHARHPITANNRSCSFGGSLMSGGIQNIPRHCHRDFAGR